MASKPSGTVNSNDAGSAQFNYDVAYGTAGVSESSASNRE